MRNDRIKTTACEYEHSLLASSPVERRLREREKESATLIRETGVIQKDKSTASTLVAVGLTDCGRYGAIAQPSLFNNRYNTNVVTVIYRSY